ncbi:ABC transporter permease [Clostridium sp. OM08-29]|nr:ABC transporter permease [Clostridium sp. OM08-29]
MLINFMFCNYLNKYKQRGSDMENYTKLSIKYLKFQKKRTILTILGVALASGILFVILTLYFSNFINTRDALRKQADYEIVLLPEQNQDVPALLKQDFVKTAYRGKYYDYYSNSYIENAIYINVKNPYRLDANMETIEQTYGVKAQLNQQLASYYLQGDTGNDTYIILLMFLLLSFVIAVIGVGIIRTTIQLNTMEQIKDYGILRCIGATQGQLKSVIFRMGCMQELLGILGGIVIGFPIAYLVGLSMNIKVLPHVLPFLYVLIVFIGDLFFVMDENGKLVKKISPIEAVRGQTSGTRKVKARKQSIFGKIFGVQGDYAYKNLMSNKRRFLKTIATFALSIAAFITIATIFTSFVQMQKQIAPSYGEYQVYFFNEANDEETIDAVKSVLPNEETLTDIAQNKEVKDVKAVYAATMKAADFEEFRTHFTEDFRQETLEGQIVERLETGEKYKDSASPVDRVSVIGYGEDEYQEYASYLVEGTLDVDENGIVLVQNVEATLDEGMDDESYDAIDLIASTVEYPATDYKLGDTIELKWGNEKKTYEIQGIVRIDKDKLQTKGFVKCIVPLANYFRMTGLEKSDSTGVKCKLRSDNISASLTSKLVNVLDNSMGDYSYPDAIYSGALFSTSISAIKYILAFVIVILCVSSLNIINTTASNLYLRRQEFAQLRAIGVSVRELRKMVMLEGVISVICANIVGDVLGFAVMMPLAKATLVLFMVKLTFPIIGAVIGFVLSVLVMCGSIYIPMKRMSNQIADDLNAAGD